MHLINEVLASGQVEAYESENERWREKFSLNRQNGRPKWQGGNILEETELDERKMI